MYEAVTVNVIGGADEFWLVARMLAFVLDVRTKLEFDQSIVSHPAGGRGDGVPGLARADSVGRPEVGREGNVPLRTGRTA